jgi:hypothetical protein
MAHPSQLPQQQRRADTQPDPMGHLGRVSGADPNNNQLTPARPPTPAQPQHRVQPQPALDSARSGQPVAMDLQHMRRHRRQESRQENQAGGIQQYPQPRPPPDDQPMLLATTSPPTGSNREDIEYLGEYIARTDLLGGTPATGATPRTGTPAPVDLQGRQYSDSATSSFGPIRAPAPFASPPPVYSATGPTPQQSGNSDMSSDRGGGLPAQLHFPVHQPADTIYKSLAPVFLGEARDSRGRITHYNVVGQYKSLSEPIGTLPSVEITYHVGTLPPAMAHGTGAAPLGDDDPIFVSTSLPMAVPAPRLG